MIGQTISHTTIAEEGMGGVFDARDVKLNQTVALKSLPHQLTATPEDRGRLDQAVRGRLIAATKGPTP